MLLRLPVTVVVTPPLPLTNTFPLPPVEESIPPPPVPEADDAASPGLEEGFKDDDAEVTAAQFDPQPLVPFEVKELDGPEPPLMPRSSPSGKHVCSQSFTI